MSDVETWFSQLQQLIEMPYAERSAEFSGWMQSAQLETHLLATPRRKTILFMDRTGDYEYDEEMNLDVEVEMAVEVDQCYQLLVQRISEVYGPALEIPLDAPSLQARIEPDYDDADDDAETRSYLSGAYYDNSDDGAESLWQVGTDYVCIQKIKDWGDGNFGFYVIATVTPCETVN